MESQNVNKNGLFQRFLNVIEKFGNKLPDILTIFIIISALILIASSIAGYFEWSTVSPIDGEEITAINLLSSDGIVMILTNMVSNFIEFPPLGVVIVAMLGVGLAEVTGLLSAVIKVMVLKSPKFLVLPMIVFIGIIGNAAGDAAFIVLPPIAAVIFLSLGMHPIAGIAIAYASVAAGYGANVLINISDVLLAGFTQTGVSLASETLTVNPSITYYFSFISTFLLIPITVFVTRRIVQPRLGTYTGDFKGESHEITPEEKKGLKWAGISVLVLTVIILILTLPENALLRDPETGSLIQSPFMDSLVPIILILSFFPALAYGFSTGKLTSDKDVSSQLTEVMKSLSYFILIAFVAGQMIAYFSWSNLGELIAIEGAGFLNNLNFTGLPLLISFIVFTSLLNFLIASTTAKWAMLAPVFIPMFMYLDIDPAITHAAYRIADSVTNPITPMLAYFPILLMAAQKFDKNIKLGTLLSVLIPYSIFFFVGWIILFSAWYLLGIPFGPGH